MKKVHRIHMDTPNKMAIMALPAATVCAACKVAVPAMPSIDAITLCCDCATRLFKEFDANIHGVPIGAKFPLLARLASYGPIKTDVVGDAMRRAKVSMSARVHQQDPST
jgi:hypothetical protein